MAQRKSGFARQPNELYETPAWVTEALLRHVRILPRVWEPAMGPGKMYDALKAQGHTVLGTDITGGYDFTLMSHAFTEAGPYAIVTNPPYGIGGKQAEAFIKHALFLSEMRKGQVAMLLHADFDAGKRRRPLFAECPAFAARIILNTRIKWFEDGVGSPSQNHCWFFWDWQHVGRPAVHYAVREAA